MITLAKTEWGLFLLALQFMTRLPVNPGSAFSEENFLASVRHYPLVGLFVGLLNAGIFVAANALFPTVVAVLVTISVSILMTGAFHEDGLADMFDGIGGGSNKERALQIMKDSRIGVFGMTALAMVLALKTSALVSMPPALLVLALVVAHAASRWSSVIAIASSRYVRDEGTAKPVAEGISHPALLFASAVGLAPFLAFWLIGHGALALPALTGLLIAHLATRIFYQRKINGYTGDCLGALQQISELGVYLGILACL
ncbi:MAG: adenosylcobinamide-GDP ribazoletransferase [Pseudomonadota bacterium]